MNTAAATSQARMVAIKTKNNESTNPIEIFTQKTNAAL
jgi:hypothetical protein